MRKITISKREYNLPESFDELSKEQFSELCKLFLATITKDRFTLFAFLILAGIPRKRLHYYIKYQELKSRFANSFLGNFLFIKLGLPITLVDYNSEQIAEKMLELTEFLHTDSMSIATEHFKEISIQGTSYKGIGDYGVNLTFGKFIQIEPLIFDYIETNDLKIVSDIFNIIYAIEKSESIEMHIKFGVFISYISFRKQIISEFEEVFKSSGGQKQQSSYNIELDWQKTLHFVAEKALNYEKYYAMPARDVLFELNEQALKAKKMQEHLTQLRK